MSLDPKDAVRIEETVNDIEKFDRELRAAVDTLVPLAREYVKDVRGVRMAFAEEVRHLVVHSQQINVMVKSTPELIKFLETISAIREILTPEFVETLRRLTKEGD